MLQIETSDPNTLPDAGLWPDWHLGDPVPNLGRYATIRLDGHELQMLLEAMRTARIGIGGRVNVGPLDYENPWYSSGRPTD